MHDKTKPKHGCNCSACDTFNFNFEVKSVRSLVAAGRGAPLQLLHVDRVSGWQWHLSLNQILATECCFAVPPQTSVVSNHQSWHPDVGVFKRF